MEYLPSWHDDLYLVHHGILGQKWGTRNGPPYPLGGGDYTETEWKALKGARENKYSKYNKKHYDEVIKEGTVIRTLARDPNRTKNVDMFYASHTKADRHRYNALYNHKTNQTLYDKDGNIVGKGKTYKWLINNKLVKDVKVASQDTGSKVMRDLYKNDRDFYNFVRDPNRLEYYTKKMYIPHNKKYIDNLHKMQQPNYKPTDKHLHILYDTVNCVIPNTAKDVTNQRIKMFNNLKDRGYSAVLDVNDAINNPLAAQSPIIVFDMDAFIPESTRMTTMPEVLASTAYNTGRTLFGGTWR